MASATKNVKNNNTPKTYSTREELFGAVALGEITPAEAVIQMAALEQKEKGELQVELDSTDRKNGNPCSGGLVVKRKGAPGFGKIYTLSDLDIIMDPTFLPKAKKVLQDNAAESKRLGDRYKAHWKNNKE